MAEKESTAGAGKTRIDTEAVREPVVASKLRKEFEEYSKIHPYKPFLPADAQPPNDLNKELMDKYRAALAKALGYL